MADLGRQHAVGEVSGNIPFRPGQGDLVDPGVEALQFVVVHHGRHGSLAFGWVLGGCHLISACGDRTDVRLLGLWLAISVVVLRL